MDIRKIALYLAGKLPPHFNKANPGRFRRLVKEEFSAYVEPEQLNFIQQQSNQTEDLFFMVLDDIYKDFHEKEGYEAFMEVLKRLEIPEELIGTSIYPHLQQRLEELANNLTSIPTGKEGAKSFENWVGDFVKTIFGDSMKELYLKEQVYSQDKLDIRDWILLNNPKDELTIEGTFRKDILQNMYNSQFVLIESKNYTDPTNQNIINCTTKYLEQPGIGRFCFLFTRNGLIEMGDERILKLLRGSSEKKPVCVLTLNDLDYNNLIRIKKEGGIPEKYLLDKFFDLQTKL